MRQHGDEAHKVPEGLTNQVKVIDQDGKHGYKPISEFAATGGYVGQAGEVIISNEAGNGQTSNPLLKWLSALGVFYAGKARFGRDNTEPVEIELIRKPAGSSFIAKIIASHTGAHTWVLPNKGGTFAMTSDLPTDPGGVPADDSITDAKLAADNKVGSISGLIAEYPELAGSINITQILDYILTNGINSLTPGNGIDITSGTVSLDLEAFVSAAVISILSDIQTKIGTTDVNIVFNQAGTVAIIDAAFGIRYDVSNLGTILANLTDGTLVHYKLLIDYVTEALNAAAIDDHNNLDGVQGGVTGERYHLSLAKYNIIQATEEAFTTALKDAIVSGGADYTPVAINIATSATPTLTGSQITALVLNMTCTNATQNVTFINGMSEHRPYEIRVAAGKKITFVHSSTFDTGGVSAEIDGDRNGYIKVVRIGSKIFQRDAFNY